MMHASYYERTASSPMVLASLNANHTLLERTVTQLVISVIFAAPRYFVSPLEYLRKC